VRHGMISSDDLKLFSFADDPATALSLLQKGIKSQAEEKPPAFAHSCTPEGRR